MEVDVQITDFGGQVAPVLLRNLCRRYKARRGWTDGKWHSESKMIKDEVFVMEPCNGLIRLRVSLCWP